ncbi:MAG: methyltransferase domain-containing protein [Planctomycetes bacterium]|nr:methyltransferase domain-containing protein [Planctomycetota bacterium]
MSHERIASTFDEWAHSGRGENMEYGHGDVVAQVLDELSIRAGFQVLDLGCGVGWATRLLAQAAPGVQAIGVDVSPAMVAEAEKLSSLRIRARYEVGRFEALDFNDGKFDLVFSMEAIYYSPDLAKALSEVHRVLKPGGRAEIVLDCYQGRPSTEHWSEAVGLHLHVLSEADWEAAFKTAGFTSVELRHVLDRRGAGDASDFEPGRCFHDFASYAAYHDAGSLWIRAVK